MRGQKVWGVVWGTYLVCYVFRLLEYFVWRTDQTWVGEAVVHKLLGIAILFFAAALMKYTPEQIGFAKENAFRNLGKGLAFGCAVFAVAYGAEILIMSAQGAYRSLDWYVSAYAIDQNIGNRTEALFFLICIIGNVINVVMEEGVFRGFFQKVLEQKYSFVVSAIIASCFFGVWHMIGPIRNFLDGTMSRNGMIANAVMLVVTSALVGFKFAMLTHITKSHYMAMGDHFVNNTIVNLLHVVSNSGADEMMVVRVSVAQSLSFVCVLVCFIFLNRKKQK